MNDQFVIYLRKSRADMEAEQHGELETLARHEKALLELANRQKLHIANIYREVVSGETIAARPMMQQLLSEVESGIWSGVLVMEVERLARGDTIDQGIVAQTFKFSNTKIITPSKVYDPNNEFDEEYFEFGLFMSRREYKTINRRLQRGRLSSVKEGKYVANKAPYGYTRVKLEKEKGFSLKPMPEQADVVKLIFELFTIGERQEDGNYKRLGVSSIARKLNNLNIKPMYSDAWVDASIWDILKNPVYNGKIRWNRRPTVKKMVNGQVKKERPRSNDIIVVDGLHEAIISEDTFDLAQSILQAKISKVTNHSVLTNPLAGIVICGKCGRVMRRKPKGDRTPYDTLMCPAVQCNNVSVRFESVENRILKLLEITLSNEKLNLNINDGIDYNRELSLINTRLQQYETELVEAKKQLNTIYDSYEKGVYSSDIFIERSKILNEKIENIKSGKQCLENDLKKKSGNTVYSKTIIPKIEHILEVYNMLPTAQDKNDLLKEVINSVTYTKERSGHWKNVDPDDYSLELYLNIS